MGDSSRRRAAGTTHTLTGTELDDGPQKEPCMKSDEGPGRRGLPSGVSVGVRGPRGRTGNSNGEVGERVE